MSDEVRPCEHGSYGLCPQCVREERDRLRAELESANRLLDEARNQEPVAIQYEAVNGKWYSITERQADIASAEFGRPIRKLYAAPVPAQPAVPDDVAKDAERYRWLRDRNNSLEARQYDKGIYNGPSCYHEVEGIRELKSESKLDAAIDAAILSAAETEGRSNG